MEKWRTFYSTWQMKMMKESKNLYVDVCTEYERLKQVMKHTFLNI